VLALRHRRGTPRDDWSRVAGFVEALAVAVEAGRCCPTPALLRRPGSLCR